MLRLHPRFIDYAILAVYFVVVLDFFLSGRSLPAWITGALAKPVMPEPPETRGEGSGRIRRAPAT
jgi:hypothetical protein